MKKINLKSVGLLLTCFATSVFADSTALYEQLMSGYTIGTKTTVTVKGQVFKNNKYLCDYYEINEKTLIDIKDGVYTFHEKITENRNCIETVEEEIEITTASILENDINLFYRWYNEGGTTLTYNKESKELTTTGNGDIRRYDLSGINTFESFGALILDSGESGAGEYKEVHGKAESKSEVIDVSKLRDKDLVVCDYRLDSDHSDSEYDFDEICN